MHAPASTERHTCVHKHAHSNSPILFPGWASIHIGRTGGKGTGLLCLWILTPKSHGTVPAHKTLAEQAFPDCTLERSSVYCSETEPTHRHDFVWKHFTFCTQGFTNVTLLATMKQGRGPIPQAWVSLTHVNSSTVFHYKTNLLWTFQFNSLVLPWNESCAPSLLTPWTILSRSRILHLVYTFNDRAYFHETKKELTN